MHDNDFWHPVIWTYRGWAARLPNNYGGAPEEAVRTLLAAGEMPAYFITGFERQRFWEFWKPTNQFRSGFRVEGSDHLEDGEVSIHYHDFDDMSSAEAGAATERYVTILEDAGWDVTVEPADGNGMPTLVKAVPRNIRRISPRRWGLVH